MQEWEERTSGRGKQAINEQQVRIQGTSLQLQEFASINQTFVRVNKITSGSFEFHSEQKLVT